MPRKYGRTPPVAAVPLACSLPMIQNDIDKRFYLSLNHDAAWPPSGQGEQLILTNQYKAER